ncbi:MAG: hypothetical protein OQJ91_15310 [Motiliproteus sp.]|nr:hypothetical protein [Motiliproteus sp.]
MKRLCVLGCAVTMMLAGPLAAETQMWRCVYQEATYDAAFMRTPETRQCPQDMCSYDIRFDSEGGLATINGTVGYSVDRSPTQLVFRRTSENPVMGGTDTAVFTVNTEKMNFVGKKTTMPSVSVTTRGVCSAF